MGFVKVSICILDYIMKNTYYYESEINKEKNQGQPEERVLW